MLKTVVNEENFKAGNTTTDYVQKHYLPQKTKKSIMMRRKPYMSEVKASMAGNVWKINVQVGDEVSAGEDVVILESMKMEIPICG